MKSYTSSILKTCLIISGILTIGEIIWYYQKFNDEIFQAFNQDYKVNYCFVTYMGVSILLRGLGIYKYFKQSGDWILFYVCGQIMAILEIFNWALGLQIPVFLGKNIFFNLNLLLLGIILITSDWNFKIFTSRAHNRGLFILLLFTLAYFFLKIENLFYTLYISSNESIFLVSILMILLYLFGIFSLIQVYRNYANSYKSVFVILGIDILIQVYFFSKVFFNMSEMNEDDIQSAIILNSIYLLVLLSILAGFIYFQNKLRKENDVSSNS